MNLSSPNAAREGRETLGEEMARILIVDDNAPVRWQLAAILESEGHQVEQASNGLQALSKFGTSSYDAVVMDVYLPSLNGLEACRRLRQRSRVPILVLSATPDLTLEKNAFAYGATGFTCKPPNVEGLLSWLRRAVTSRQQPNGASSGQCLGAC